MNVALAYVFVDRVIGNVAYWVSGPVSLGMNSGIVVFHRRQERIARLISILSRDCRIGNRGLKFHTVSPCPVYSILQRDAYGIRVA